MLSTDLKLATVKSLKADVSSVSPSLERWEGLDEGLTLETSAFKLCTVANLRFHLS